MKRITVAVLYGGRSPEHSISCVSAGAVMSNLDPQRYEIVPVGITRDGEWVQGTRDFASLRIQDRQMPFVDGQGEKIALETGVPEAGVIRFVDGARAGEVLARVDVVFPVLHGPMGEDGTIQGLLELSGIPYVGPGVFASAACMDKEFTKKVLGEAGLPIGDQVVLRRDDATVSADDRERLGLPVFVKPARGGSSIGVSKVSSWDRLDAAIAAAREHDPKVIVEAGMIGREIECGVLEMPDGEVRASLPAEIHFPDGPVEPHAAGKDAAGKDTADAGDADAAEQDAASDAFYDFDTKYLDAVSTFDLPAKLTAEQTAELQAEAIRAFRAVDAKSLARVDFFVTESGPVINEINTMPGFTPISMYPQMWAETGVPYAELLATLVQTALERG